VQPSGDAGEVDVVFVWRGTIFREEWSNNFAFDRLVGGGQAVIVRAVEAVGRLGWWDEGMVC